MAELPPIDMSVAFNAGASVLRAGPVVSRAEAAAVVAGLRRALEASIEPALEVTQLDVDPTGDDAVVDRRTWMRLNLDMAETMLGRTGISTQPLNLRTRVQAGVNGVQLGTVFAYVSSRIMGQYLPFRDDGLLVLVAPNIVAVETAMGVVPADFRLWVALHERTHQLQFTKAPWLLDHMVDSLANLMDSGSNTKLPQRGAGLVGALLSPEQREVLDRLSSSMALLEGYADVMMDRVGTSKIRTLTAIRRRFEQRRARGGWTAVANKLLGMDLKLAQYREGAAFCRAVIDEVGVPGLNVAYDSPQMLPSPDEIADPSAWVGRVHG